MKKSFKILILITTNIIIAFILFIILDISILKIHNKKIPQRYKSFDTFCHNISSPSIWPCENLENFFTGEDKTGFLSGRAPEGTEYKTSPIVIFGCSFGRGFMLEENQTFGYKLSHLLKRPVYNRSVDGGSLQYMYLQAISDYFYKEVPDSKDYIYIMINDHYRRMLGEHFDYEGTLCSYFYFKNNKLIHKKHNNYLTNFIETSSIYQILKKRYNEKILYNERNEQYLTDFVVKYFSETKNAIEKRLKHKINFTVILYDNVPILYKDTLIKKLNAIDIKVLETSKLANKNLLKNEYLIAFHPNEKAWNILTEPIAKEINKNK